MKGYKVFNSDWICRDFQYKECMKCADEHRQLAEWLKDLLRFKNLKCKTCNEYDTEENWCYRHGVDRSYDDFCSDWEN